MATRENSGPVSGIANVGIRRAEIKQGKILNLHSVYKCMVYLLCQFKQDSLKIGLHCTYLDKLLLHIIITQYG